MRRGYLLALALATAVAPLGAQAVGTLPEKSPFTDLRDGHRVGVFAGAMSTGHDPAGVGPGGGAVIGARYDLHAGGPVYLTGRLLGFSGKRSVLDYTKSSAQRVVGSASCGVAVADLGLSVALTGPRSWHGLQPLVNAAVGLATGFGDTKDVSGYAFSTAFSLSYGLGLRFVTGRNSELRADASWFRWQVKYPETFRSTEGDSVAIHPSGSLSPWVGNRAISVSWTVGIFR